MAMAYRTRTSPSPFTGAEKSPLPPLRRTAFFSRSAALPQ